MKVIFKSIALILLLSGCLDDEFYYQLGEINQSIEKSRKLYVSGQYEEVLEVAGELESKIDSLFERYPQEADELMPHLYKAIVFSFISSSYGFLNEIEKRNDYELRFKEQLEKIGVENLNEIGMTEFLETILKRESDSDTLVEAVSGGDRPR